MIAEFGVSPAELGPIGAMQLARQTSLATRPMHLAAELYVGPSHGRGLWASARDALATLARPIARWLGLPLFVELHRLGAAAARLNELLRPMVRSTYHRDDLDAIAADPAIDQVHRLMLAQSLRVIDAMPSLARSSGEPHVFPNVVTRDETVRMRVTAAARLLQELNAAVVTPPVRKEAIEQLAQPPSDPCPWAYDPAVPPALARRLMAGRRAAFAPIFVQAARGTWPVQAQRQAALDWADDVSDLVGLVAALPGIVIPSLPASAVVDLEAMMEEHAAVRAAREVHLKAAIDRNHAG